MRREAGVLAVFSEPGAAAEAVRALKTAGHDDVRAAMPAAFPEVLAALGRPRSRLGVITFTAGAIGVGLGFALCVATAVAWPLVTGGKPIASPQPFAIIAFEVAVLVGGLANLAALAVTTWLGRRRRSVPKDLRFSTDRLGIFAVGGDGAAAEAVLRAHGAEEVRRVG